MQVLKFAACGICLDYFGVKEELGVEVVLQICTLLRTLFLERIWLSYNSWH